MIVYGLYSGYDTGADYHTHMWKLYTTLDAAETALLVAMEDKDYEWWVEEVEVFEK